MANLKQSSSDFVWNIVGLLAAFSLILYMASTFFNVDVSGFIPVSGGGGNIFSDPTLFPTRIAPDWSEYRAGMIERMKSALVQTFIPQDVIS